MGGPARGAGTERLSANYSGAFTFPNAPVSGAGVH